MQRKHRIHAVVALMLAGLTGGCSGTAPVLSLPSPGETSPPAETSATAEAIPEQDSATSKLKAFLMPKDLVVGTPTEVYTRIARGVLTCWFGAAGPLKGGYIYHADAEPASKGGSSEIKILTRDAAAEDPRSIRAYRIGIYPSDGKTKVEIENVRLSEPLALRLKEDIERWSADEAGCGTPPVTAGWSAEQVVDTKADGKKKEKSKKP